MDSVFSVISEEDRASHLRSLMEAFGCNYICLWLFLPQPTQMFQFLFGLINANLVMKKQIMNMENTMRNWFSEDIPQRSPLTEFSQPIDPSRLSSSSSSLRSLSKDSPKRSPFLFNIPTTSHISETPQDPTLQPMPTTSTAIQQQVVLQSLHPIQATTAIPVQYSLQSLQAIPSATSATLHQVMHAFALARNIQFPTQESEDSAMTKAILAVLTSPSISSFTLNLRQRATAFKKYVSLTTTTTATRLTGLRRQSMLKRAFTYYRNLNIERREHMQASRPTSTQIHHKISERRRREKINESFEALRKLLPPEPKDKKDKASVLNRTSEYLTSLKVQVAELIQRNQKLEAQVLVPVREGTEEVSESSNERVEVRVARVSETTSEEERTIDLQIFVRGDSANLSNIVIRILEFLKQHRNVNLMSVEATARTTESRSLNRVILRLRIEGNGWDESAFQEAVRSVVADLAH
ncbi:putative transcription factor bHLH041 [Jatropha curcas]|uniref:putative transcription factor bHLH041 n=1 Tax=Jatropha curcas TaxID=180498 RepID=UPI0018944D30|nr:putative transcription factor bHLH041 [Jatropha curcas]